MHAIKILGTGCANCKSTHNLVEDVLASKGLQARVDKVEDIASIMRFGVMRTPAVVVDGRVVHAGGVPSRSQVEHWLAS